MKPFLLSGALLGIAAALGGCLMGNSACVDSGVSKLYVPVARLTSVASVSTSGSCVVEALPAACGPGVTCVDLRDGQRIVQLSVTGTKLGKCTVTITYNDGCASESLEYVFGGPLNNCCEDICARSRSLDPVSASCPAK
jgi:hypothetical protein